MNAKPMAAWALVLLVLVNAHPSYAETESGHHFVDPDYPSPLARIDTMTFSYVESPDMARVTGEAMRRASVFDVFRVALAEVGVTLKPEAPSDHRLPTLEFQ